MARLIKFQVALVDHLFDGLIHLSKQQHRTYREQANYYLEEAVKRGLLAEEQALDDFLEAGHASAS